MVKPENADKRWSAEQIAALRRMLRENTPTRVLALRLKRTPVAVQAKVNDLGMSTKPVNQSPYNRRKK